MLIQPFALIDVDRSLKFAPSARILAAGGRRGTTFYSVDNQGMVRKVEDPGKVEFILINLEGIGDRRGLFFVLTPTEEGEISGQHLLALETGLHMLLDLDGISFELFAALPNAAGFPHLLAFSDGGSVLAKRKR